MKTLMFVVLILASLLMAQTSKPVPDLVVDGKTVGQSLVQSGGRYYVDIDALARAVGGSIQYHPNQVVLSLTPNQAVPRPGALSQRFQEVSIATLGDMREWQGAIEMLINTSLPTTNDMYQGYRRRVEQELSQASVAATTPGDHSVLQLLLANGAKLAEWADNVVSERLSLEGSRFVDPNALQNDPVLNAITQCGQSLNAMIVENRFSDAPSCH